jgi:hypothetical protein
MRMKKALPFVIAVLALAEFGAVRSGDQPPSVAEAKNDSLYFRDHVMPLIDRFGCNAATCHGAPGNKTGLQLELFGADAEADYAAIVKKNKVKLIDKTEPAKSLLVLKVSGGTEHRGGKAMPSGSAEYQRVVAWISQGALYADKNAPALTEIKIAPDKQALRKGESKTLQVKAAYEDGSEKDVTAEACYRTLDSSIGEVAPGGQITAKGFGETAIVATYLRQTAVVRVAVPQTLLNGFPPAGANNKIDEWVNAKLKELGIPPSELCTDQEYLRRVFLDAIGVLPKPDEVRTFLADKDPQKRGKLVDLLLERAESARTAHRSHTHRWHAP